MMEENNNLIGSKFLSHFMEKTFLYEGLYQIKKTELQKYLDKIKISENIEGTVNILRNTFEAFSGLSKIQKDFISVLFKGDIQNLKESLELIDSFGSPLLNLAKKHFENLTYESLLEFERINYLIFIFIEFDNYIFNSFKYILERRPDLLMEKKIDFKLKDFEFYIKDNEDNYLYSFLAEKVIERKLYGDYIEIFEYAKKKLGLKHSFKDDDIQLLDACKKIRNIYVHSDGRITNILLMKIQKKLPKFFEHLSKNYSVGDKYKLRNNFINLLQKFIFATIKELDKLLIKAHPELISLRLTKNKE